MSEEKVWKKYTEEELKEITKQREEFKEKMREYIREKQPGLASEGIEAQLESFHNQFIHHQTPDFDKWLKKKNKPAKNNDKTEPIKKVNATIDPRFEEPALLKYIHDELDKMHKLDDKEKIALFIIRATGELPDPRDHCSAALKGDSSAGKDNVIDTVLLHYPSEDNFKLTRGTQAALEEEAARVKCIAFSEINKHREGGANAELTEVFKQFAEGGVSVLKKDPATNYKTTLHIETEQKTLLYGTTETGEDDELETRYVAIPIRGYVVKNQIVVNDALNKAASEEHYAEKLGGEESWITTSIRGLDKDLQPIIPYAPLLEEKIRDSDGQEKYFFDFSKERIKRDAKRLLSITRAITWLHQRQRHIGEIDGRRFVYAEPSDFLMAVEIFAEFFNLTYRGLDHRIQRCYEKIKDLEGKHAEDVIAAGYPTDKVNWVFRHKLQDDLGVGSINTIKSYIETLHDHRLIETFWDNSKPKGYLVKTVEGVNQGVNRVSMPINSDTLTGYLTSYLTPDNIKRVYGEKKITPLLRFLDSISQGKCEIDTLKIDTLKSSEEEQEISLLSQFHALFKGHYANQPAPIGAIQAKLPAITDDIIVRWKELGEVMESPPGWVRPV